MLDYGIYEWSIMKTRGPIWRDLLLLMMFWTTLVLFISLPISQTNDSTLGESIFGRLERQKERNERSNKKVIGSGITDHVQN
jgi:hypothetical protein